MGFYIVYISPFVNALCTLQNYRRNGHKKLHPDLSSSQGAVLVFSSFLKLHFLAPVFLSQKFHKTPHRKRFFFDLARIGVFPLF